MMQLLQRQVFWVLVTCFSLVSAAAVTSSSPTSSFTCDFEDGMCGWQAQPSIGYTFRRHNGSTPDRTSGPDGDHTIRGCDAAATSAGHYVFSSGWDANNRTALARLLSPEVEVTETSHLSVWYQMNGHGVGSLALILHQRQSRVGGAVTSSPSVAWNITGRQGLSWGRKQVRLPPGNWQVEFQSTVKLNYGSDIALDDIQLVPVSAQVTTSTPVPCTTSTTTSATTATRSTSPTTTPHTTSPTASPTTTSPVTSPATSPTASSTTSPTTSPATSRSSTSVPRSTSTASTTNSPTTPTSTTTHTTSNPPSSSLRSTTTISITTTTTTTSPTSTDKKTSSPTPTTTTTTTTAASASTIPSSTPPYVTSSTVEPKTKPSTKKPVDVVTKKEDAVTPPSPSSSSSAVTTKKTKKTLATAEKDSGGLSTSGRNIVIGVCLGAVVLGLLVAAVVFAQKHGHRSFVAKTAPDGRLDGKGQDKGQQEISLTTVTVRSL